MLFKIAWRNIWRNPLRSAIVIGSIVLGIWAIIFLASLVFGMVDSYVKNAIKNEVTHIQIMHPKFPEDEELKYTIDSPEIKMKLIADLEGVQSVGIRLQTNAMIASSRNAQGVKIIAINPENEKINSGIPETVIEGNYFEGDKRNPILVSKSIVEKLHLKLRSKVVLTFQDGDKNMQSAAFRIRGIFDTKNKMFDDVYVFVKKGDFARLSGMKNQAHKITVFLDDLKYLDTVQTQIKALFPNLLVQNYEEVSPDLALFKNQINIASSIYIFIFMLALIFGIINTMLMAVLERFKELGMLMSIGMNKWKVFRMIMIETLLLAAFGMPIGLLIGYLSTSYFNKHGINLFFYSDKGMEQFGLAKFIYPSLSSDVYIELALAVVITAFLASLYPAYKAISIRPIDALQKL